MAIKRREKPLTPAEAVALAKQQLAPYWFGHHEPLMAAVREGGGVRAYPLDSWMTERAWLIFFVDPFSLSARDALLFAQSWAHRYEPQKLNVMVILKLPFEFSQESEWGHKFSQQFTGAVVTVMDRDSLLHQAFQVTALPHLILLHQNKRLFDRAGSNWYQGAEPEVQKFLRLSDPGLPLFEPLTEPENPVQNQFEMNIDGAHLDQSMFQLEGKWSTEKARIVTQDPHAAISFQCEGKKLAIIAQALAERGESEMVVELSRDYPKDGGILGEDLNLDVQVLGNPLAEPIQKRRAQAMIGAPRLYSLFRALPESHREVTLRFPRADKVPVAFYGLRFGN
jgi:hypothetical protein